MRTRRVRDAARAVFVAAIVASGTACDRLLPQRDLTLPRPDAVAAMYDKLEESTDRLHILINNAGVPDAQRAAKAARRRALMPAGARSVARAAARLAWRPASSAPGFAA